MEHTLFKSENSPSEKLKGGGNDLNHVFRV